MLLYGQMWVTRLIYPWRMRLGDSGIAFLPGGSMLPPGPYPVYARVDVDDNGAVRGEVHFGGEPKHPRPISLNQEFDLHVAHPDSILGDSIVLTVRFVDQSGTVMGYRHGSLAQFRPEQHTEPHIVDTSLNSRHVFVIHGRDKRLRDGMFAFLRSLGLNPMEWAHAVELTGKGAPYVGEVLDAAFTNAQAVVVLFTPDDLAKLRPDLRSDKEPDHEVKLTPQARPNVLFEAGMAMAANPDRTILVEISALRPFSDIGGRHTIRMDNSTQKRNELASRLKKAGCPVNLSGTDWHTAGDLIPPVVQLPAEQDSNGETTNAPRLDQIEQTTHLADLVSELEDNLESARAPRVGDVYARPSNRVWKEHRNRVDIPQDMRSRIVNAYRQIDQWYDIVASGLNPNTGSMALELKVNDLRHELPGLITDLKKLRRRSRNLDLGVSAEGETLLLQACEDKSGTLIVTEVMEGLIVQAHGKQLAETGNPRSEAKWRRAVRDLERSKLIERLAPDGDVYAVTHEGYQLADELRAELG